VGHRYRVKKGLCSDCAAIEQTLPPGRKDAPVRGEAFVLESMVDGCVVCVACETTRLTDRQAFASNAKDAAELARLAGLLDQLRAIRTAFVMKALPGPILAYRPAPS
jgi:hypothetical protein